MSRENNLKLFDKFQSLGYNVQLTLKDQSTELIFYDVENTIVLSEQLNVTLDFKKVQFSLCIGVYAKAKLDDLNITVHPKYSLVNEDEPAELKKTTTSKRVLFPLSI
jgi:hypothetical protein